MKKYYVYIMASGKNGTLYIGVTSNLARRIWEHKESQLKGFTQKYSVHRLVYVEEHEEAIIAIQREKSLKRWYRKWKIELINQHNPGWKDLYEALV